MKAHRLKNYIYVISNNKENVSKIKCATSSQFERDKHTVL